MGLSAYRGTILCVFGFDFHTAYISEYRGTIFESEQALRRSKKVKRVKKVKEGRRKLRRPKKGKKVEEG
jgi:hypothetical protein